MWSSCPWSQKRIEAYEVPCCGRHDSSLTLSLSRFVFIFVRVRSPETSSDNSGFEANRFSILLVSIILIVFKKPLL